jgi:hypothetical protein
MAFYARLDAFVVGLERRLGPFASVAVGAAGLALACLWVRPASVPQGLGTYYAWLSLDPFEHAANNPVAFRPLTAWISWAVGLRGDALRYTNLFFAGVLLACVFEWFRRQAPRPGDALLATAAICFSGVTLGVVFSTYYCDALTLLVAFGMWCTRRHPLAFYGLFALGLFNRESLLFLVPWFAFVQLCESQQRARTLVSQVVGYGAGVVLYAAFRAWSAEPGGSVRYDLAYYLGPLAEDPLHFFRQSARYQWAGFYSVFGPAWAIPAAGAVAMWQRGEHARPLGLALLLVSVWAQLWVAVDSSRLFTLAFPVMIVALEELFRSGALRFREWAPWLLLLAALAPPTHAAANRFWVMDSLWTWHLWR